MNLKEHITSLLAANGIVDMLDALHEACKELAIGPNEKEWKANAESIRQVSYKVIADSNTINDKIIELTEPENAEVKACYDRPKYWKFANGTIWA